MSNTVRFRKAPQVGTWPPTGASLDHLIALYREYSPASPSLQQLIDTRKGN